MWSRTGATVRNSLLAAIFVVLSLADMVTTHLALAGGAREGNPFAIFVMTYGGEPLLYLVKIAVLSLVALIGQWRGLTVFLAMLDVLMMVVVLANLSHV